MLSFRAWEKIYFLGLNNFGFKRREYTGADIVIAFDFEWYVEKPFGAAPYVNLSANTYESLMFKIDLYLLDNNWEVVEPFVFPYEEEYQTLRE